MMNICVEFDTSSSVKLVIDEKASINHAPINMTTCFEHLFWPQEMRALLLALLSLKLIVGVSTTFLAIHFIRILFTRKDLPKTRFTTLCGIGSVLYMIVNWPQISQFPFIYYSYLANDDQVEMLERQCNVNLNTVMAILRTIYTFLAMVTYCITFWVYFERLKTCFQNSTFAIGTGVHFFFHINL